MLHHKHIKKTDHIQAITSGFFQLSRVPIVSFFNIIILAFALFLPTSFYVLWKNIGPFNNNWNKSITIALYLKKNIDQKAASRLLEKLNTNEAIAKVELITPEKGMENLIKHKEFEKILIEFKENPLPNTIIVYPNLSKLQENQVAMFVTNLKNLSAVETIKTNTEWIERWQCLMRLGKQLLIFFALSISLGSILIFCYTTYTIPKLIVNKTHTSKLILQCQCFWYGLISGLIALLLTNFVLLLLQNPYFVLHGLGVAGGIMLVLASVLLHIVISNLTIKNIF